MSENAPPAPDFARLPVWGTVKSAFGFVFGNLGLLARVGMTPLLLSVALALAAVEVLPLTGEAPPDGRQLLFNILSGLILVPFMTAWHRAALLPDEPAPGWFSYKVGRAEFRFLWNSIVIGICAAVAFLPFLLVGGLLAGFGSMQGGAVPTELGLPVVLLGIIGVAFALFVTARLSLILPAAAVDAPAGLRDSWRATRGQAWRIVAAQILMQFCILLVSLLFYAFLMPLVAIVTSGGALVTGDDQGAMRVAAISAAIPTTVWSFFGAALYVSTLSMIYRHLTAVDSAHLGRGQSGNASRV